jgi:hypothetical protein
MKTVNKPRLIQNRPFRFGNHSFVGLLVGAGALFFAHLAPAAALISSFGYTFRTSMTHSSVDPDAFGIVSGTLNRRGTATDNQRLTISASKLNVNTTYYLVAYLGDNATATPVADFTTDRLGKAVITYVQTAIQHLMPTLVNPISNLRELDIVNANGDLVLQSDLANPTTFSYSLRRAMDNTGFIPGASGTLWLTISPHTTRVWVLSAGLKPRDSYKLLVNGAEAAAKASYSNGRLLIVAPKTGSWLPLGIRTVSLADSTATSLILTSSGLGIPGSISTAGQAPVVLGAAGDYAVLAGSTITSINATTVHGDLGLAPGSAVTGFPPGTVDGTIHAGDSAAGLAKAALTVAYNDAKGRSLAPVSVAGNLGGQTLSPGLYKSTGSLEVSSGDLVLDAKGNASGVFIFQIASTLTTTSSRQVILSGGAKAANIFWQVGSSATLGTTSIFKGTIMADQSITIGTGATLDGRALARIGAVTMDSNTITIPAAQ